MDDGISINVASTAITALGSGGVGALLMHIFGGGRKKSATDDHEKRIRTLELNDARQTTLLESIDERLKQMNDIFTKILTREAKQ